MIGEWTGVAQDETGAEVKERMRLEQLSTKPVSGTARQNELAKLWEDSQAPIGGRVIEQQTPHWHRTPWMASQQVSELMLVPSCQQDMNWNPRAGLQMHKTLHLFVIWRYRSRTRDAASPDVPGVISLSTRVGRF